MKRLYLTVEGQTEQAFAVDVLQPHLSAFNVFVTKPRLTGPHGRRGGRIPHGGMFHTFVHALADMQRWLREDTSPEARFSMMVDLYSLPHDVPGYAQAMTLADPYAQVAILEAALANAVKDQRFIPYLTGARVRSIAAFCPEKFAELFEHREKQIAMLVAEGEPFASPELINHGQHTHPKARIKQYLADYDENVDGPLLAHAVGLHLIRQKCPHFNRWLTKLEDLDQERSPC